MTTKTMPAAAPVQTNTVILGSIGVRLLAHASEPGAYFIQARDVRFGYPRQENLDAALALLEVVPAADPIVGGMFASVKVTADELNLGNGVAKMLKAAVDAYVASVAAASEALAVGIAVASGSAAES